LGVRLFERGAPLLQVTEEGRRLQARTHALLTETTEVGEVIKGGVADNLDHLRRRFVSPEGLRSKGSTGGWRAASVIPIWPDDRTIFTQI
jgi:DNA-binding transcriptional LysR family regulator